MKKKAEKKSGKSKRKKKAENRALNFEKHTKCKKIFFKYFLLAFWPKTFLTSMKLIYTLSQISLVSVNFLKNECSSESENLFGCTE